MSLPSTGSFTDLFAGAHGISEQAAGTSAELDSVVRSPMPAIHFNNADDGSLATPLHCTDSSMGVSFAENDVEMVVEPVALLEDSRLEGLEIVLNTLPGMDESEHTFPASDSFSTSPIVGIWDD